MPHIIRKQGNNINFGTPYSNAIITTAAELGVDVNDVLSVTISNWSGATTTFAPFCAPSGNIGIMAGEPGVVSMVELLIVLK